jgi:hypothetical protein
MSCLDELEVVLRCERDQTSVRFAERHVVGDVSERRLLFVVELRAPGLHARVEEVTNFADGAGLSRFLDALDFRGWEGERRWADVDRDVAVSAVFEPRGHIALTWTLAPWLHYARGWHATVTTRMEAGAQKDALVADLREFMTAEGSGIDYYEGRLNDVE